MGLVGLPGYPGDNYKGQKGEMGDIGPPGIDGTWENLRRLELKGPPGDYGPRVSPTFYDETTSLNFSEHQIFSIDKTTNNPNKNNFLVRKKFD